MRRYLGKLRAVYQVQRYNAKKRNIAFNLTFKEWLHIWQVSGHLHERGRHSGQYVMARFGDKGPYAVGNVKIILMNDNMVEANTGRKKSVDTRARMSAALVGRTFSHETRAKMSTAKVGRPMPEEVRTKISASMVGRPKSEETRARMSAAQQRRAQQAQQV